MLPEIDLVRRRNTDYLLMNSPDQITNTIKQHGIWGELGITVCQLFMEGKKNKIVKIQYQSQNLIFIVVKTSDVSL
jgi:hypothetical protein